MLLALLWPDPCDHLCPEDFKAEARRVLPKVPACDPGTSDAELRRALLRFIADFANWDLAASPVHLEAARSLVKAAYPEETPLVVDPFAGGGAIPLEALRVGCEVFSSDLNPVACLILKVMLEDIPRHGLQLADELRRVGAEIKRQAEKELADLYPKDPDGATPIAYLWARTVQCEAPNCGAEVPLVRSFWLCKKTTRKRALKYRIDRIEGQPPRIELEVFAPESDEDVPVRTVANAKATCPACGAVLPAERVRSQLAANRGGADVTFDNEGGRIGGARLMAVVTLKPGVQGRHYRPPNRRDYDAVWRAQRRLLEIVKDWERGGRQGLCPVPDEPLPPVGTLGFRVQRYGMLQWGDLFTARQKVALVTLARGLRSTSVLGRPLSLALGKLADLANDVCPWEPIAECPRNVLSNGRLKPAWDFAEGVITSEASGGVSTCIENLASGIESVRSIGSTADSTIAAAQKSPLPSDAASVWFTDPPYYDAIPYADLSDFFYVWYRRTVPEHVPGDPFDPDNRLTPKTLEIVHDGSRVVGGLPKDRHFFEAAMADAFREGRRVTSDDGIAAIVFAHKTTEGWEALLSGMTRGGWTLSGSWPVATEQAHRLRARDSAALATSIHLICRPRPDDAAIGDWGDVLRELPQRVGDWMERLQSEGVRGADLVFACIGPALEIFSRYCRVETADGHEVALADYLQKVWEVVGRLALEQVLGTAEASARNGAAGVLEEDARLTALFLWTLQSTNGEQSATPAEVAEAGDHEEAAEDEEEETTSARKPKGYALVFDVVRRFAQPLGIDLPKWEDRVIQTKKGVVYLMPIAERARVLFGREGAKAVAKRLERPISPAHVQGTLFSDPEMAGAGEAFATSPKRTDLSTEALEGRHEVTTLDRVHAAMLLQAGGQTNALRNLLAAEQERGPEFLRLANALSALYPRGSEEKRLLDAMLLAVPR